MVGKLAGPRFPKGQLTPDEAKRRQAYYTAYYQVSQSKPQYKSFVAMRGYDIDPKFRDELIRKVFPPSFAAEYPKLVAQAKSQNQAFHNEAEEIRAKQAAKEQAEAQKASNKLQADFEAAKIQAAQTPEQRALNRCITAGRAPATCMGGMLSKPFDEIVATVLPSVGKTLPPEMHIEGAFQGNGGWRIEFDDRFAMVTCAGLHPEQENYKLELKNDRAVLTVGNSPKPFSLTVRPDGLLEGPGMLL